MSNPGIHDPYWYESFVGLTKIVDMLNSDSGITCVIFQHNDYSTIDDVVVEFEDGKKQICYQVKHQIETSSPNNLTFGKMIERKNGRKCLFEAIYFGWKHAIETTGISIQPVLFSNRVITGHRSGRNYNGKKYSAYPIDEFISKMQLVIRESNENNNQIIIEDYDLRCQWEELQDNIKEIETDSFFDFINDFKIEANQLGLEELQESIVTNLSQKFSCNKNIALELFGRLLYGLSKWTVVGRESQRVTLEDVYSYLSIESDFNDSQHRLAPPYPFFESRRVFCEDLKKQIMESSEKVVFLSGDPGSGKTSTISYLQAETNLFSLRFHTFKPISPEQHFYNSDPGMCTAENLWGTLLIQLRQKFKGRISECNIPVSNKLLTVDGMRDHVMRLIKILAREGESQYDKTFICVDGLDHAARSNADMSFLKTLPNPSEIPDGVCFVIAGQPIEMYQNQYPIWLTSGTGVKQINMPKLQANDIKQLLLVKANQLTNSIDGLTELIFNKTEGNNLSAVYAIEEIKSSKTVDEAIIALSKSGIGSDIQTYYSYIWDHMKKELSKISLGTVFPESVVACPLLLMNGRINTSILANAIQNDLNENDWKMIMNNLYPLVVSTETDGEYALFHNDFRVFLMSIISKYQERYENYALQLAEYLLKNDVGMNTYVLGIPLLQLAKHEELIPQYFDEKYVINALAAGISKQRMDEYARMSYKVSCDKQNFEGYLNTYFAIKTLHQHKRYFEFYGKAYFEKDFPEINTIDISEIRVLPIENCNIDEYNRVLDLCKKLFKSKIPEHKNRAKILYDKWYGNCTANSFINICKEKIQEEKVWELKTNSVGILLQNWGSTAADLGVTITKIPECNSKLEEYAVLIFGDQYFTRCIYNEQYDLSLDALNKGYVSKQCFIEHMETIYFSGNAKLFKSALERLNTYDEEPEYFLLSHSIQATLSLNYIPNQTAIDITQKITQIYDKTSFQMTLKAFLIGIAKKDYTDQKLLNIANEICSEINARINEKEVMIYFARTSILLGKYYWIKKPVSQKLFGYVCWFLNAKIRRSFDYNKAYSFMLFTLLQSNFAKALGNDSDFIESLQYNLFEVNLLGMYYKIYILDYLIKNERLDIVDKYIITLYGENCSKICLEEDKADMHKRFEKYGNKVEPELMQDFSNQLKWDLVGYISHKEYAMHSPLELFEIIAEGHPEKWRNLGFLIYNQSLLAGDNNDVAYDIDCSIEKAAVRCGIDSYIELRNWNNDFRLNPNYIYNMLLSAIDAIDNINDLKSLWILSCGIHSWYTLEEQNCTKNVYDACCKKARELKFDFSKYVLEVTPQWNNIINHLNSKKLGIIEQNEYFKERLEKEKAIKEEYEKLSVNEALNLFVSTPLDYYFSKRFNIVYEKIKSIASNSIVELEFLLKYSCSYLGEKEWVYSDCDFVISALLSELGDNAFWEIANSLQTHLSDYDYQVSSHNIQTLLKLAFKHNSEIIEKIFIREIQTQEMWVNGNGNVNINVEVKNDNCHEMHTPKLIPELVLVIILEQIDMQNARKTEAAVYALYLLGKEFPYIIDVIIDKWQNLSRNQKRWLMLVICRWVSDNIYTMRLKMHMEKLYYECIELSEKYYLHSILIRLDPEKYNTISYKAYSKKFQFPSNSATDSNSCYENFLSLLDKYGIGEMSKKIRCYILQLDQLENYVDDPYGEVKDSKIPVIGSQVEELLYCLEQNGFFDSIPLQAKKSRLLFPEDSFILTELPCMTFDNDWFLNVPARDSSDNDCGLSSEQLKKIVHSNVSDTDIVLSANLWYPWGHNGGAIYVESTILSSESCEIESKMFDWCLGNYGLLISEGNLEETNNVSSLFNRIGGSHIITYGNCQLVPSSIWRAVFNCRPSDNDPFSWLNEDGNTVLKFERIASPYRQTMQESYIRQPILFRWICNKKWLTTTLSSLNVKLVRIFNKTNYPNFEQ